MLILQNALPEIPISVLSISFLRHTAHVMVLEAVQLGSISVPGEYCCAALKRSTLSCFRCYFNSQLNYLLEAGEVTP